MTAPTTSTAAEPTVPRRVRQIRARLRVIGARRLTLCDRLTDLDDKRERLLAELEQVDRRAYRAEAL